MNINAFASGIWNDLNQPSITSPTAIAWWLYYNVGRLNTMIYTNYSGVSGSIVPDMGPAEASIYKDIYIVKFWERMVNSNVGAAAWDASVIQVTEGNRTIKVTDRNNIAKTCLAAKDSAQKDLMQLIALYKINAATPYEVSDGIEPFWGFGINGPLEGYGYDDANYRGAYDLQ